MLRLLNQGAVAGRLGRVAVSAAVALALLLVAMTVSRPGHSQELWMERAQIIEQLAKKFAEAPVALGIADNGGVIELLTTGTGSTWTILITLPNGMSRVVATGESWTALPQQVNGRMS